MFIQRRDRDDNTYSRLQKQSVELLQKLSGNRWTDYNEHDPGVTLLDALSYALLEFSYQLGFDFEQLLANPSGELEYAQLGLLPASEVFAPCIVTPRDYETLIKEHLSGIKACKVEPLTGNRYRIYVDVEEGRKPEELLKQVRELYHRNRNLCETLEDVQLKTLPSSTSKHSKQTAVAYQQEAERKKVPSRYHPHQRPIAYELPDCYGVNERGLPPSSSNVHKAQAMQLKAYLLIFDCLLLAQKQQLDKLHQTLSLSGKVADAFTPELNLDDFDKLLDRQPLQQSEIFCKEDQHKHKAAYLDVLDTLYGESTGHLAQSSYHTPEEVNRQRARLIRLLPHLNKRRFCGINLIDNTTDSMPGIKQLINALYNNTQKRETPLTNLFGRYSFLLVSDETVYRELYFIFDIRYLVEEIDLLDNKQRISHVPRLSVSFHNKEYGVLRKFISFFSHNILFENFLENGFKPENYRMETLENGSGYLLLYKHSALQIWLNLGLFHNRELLTRMANLLWNFVDMLNTESSTFYLVEQLLLQANNSTATDCNKLSIVLPKWKKTAFKSNGYLQQLTERLPAHLHTQLLWLSADDIYRFEKHYYAWRKALASGNQAEAEQQAQGLKTLLN